MTTEGVPRGETPRLARVIVGVISVHGVVP